MFDKNRPYNELVKLPPLVDLETKEILRATNQANKLLAELKGRCLSLPDPSLLINTIVLQESKDSSAIENIVTTQDELYRAVISPDDINKPATKEVLQYREALYLGYHMLNEHDLITTNLLVKVMQRLKATTVGIRNAAGTRLISSKTKDAIYTPPEGEQLIREKLHDLEQYIHDDHPDDPDPLIKMALIHYQFEAIHPFADGNGRTGRILNVLYLVQKKLLTLPVLYLSSYIINHKDDYYRLLRAVTEEQKWHEWILFMLSAIAETSSLTLQKIEGILRLYHDTLEKVRETLPNTNARDINDLLFSYPYVKIKTLELNGIAKRQTASLYLQQLAQAGVLIPLKYKKEIYYVNYRLMDLITG
ncbi:Fic family protein [Arsenicibacter rosenii]|uniref:Fido domain-containing protein n=1 Tax=Arsenicibacter rosenii TaxID=1750698 RepID=A0A1S2V9U3_9BACT|nr:Fic/DOC family N-terminal domain-containing protein [Arsenicibacter rosenii]OIN55507.1 hypothetical protein BLX24_29920 [Arsenicibacter rosenii]